MRLSAIRCSRKRIIHEWAMASKKPRIFAEFERGIIRERVNAGLARAGANGTKLGRRRVKPSVEARILELRAQGDGILKIGRKLGVGTSVVHRVFKQEPWQS
jgi:DNA invertase Pin-like site-specific DNA recombinase